MYNKKLVNDLDKRRLFKTNKFHDSNTEEEYYWDDHDTHIYNPGIRIKTYITPSQLLNIHYNSSSNTKLIYNKIPNIKGRVIKKLIIIYNTHIKIIPFQHSSTQTGYYQPVKQSKSITPRDTVKHTKPVCCHDASTQTDNPSIQPHPEYYFPGTNNYFTPFFSNFKIAK